MFNNGDSEVMFYRKRLGYYSNQSKNAKFYHDECKATSYDWWMFVKKYGNTVVFNDHYYSSATGYHQRGVRSLLKELGIRVHVNVNFRESLSYFSKLTDFLPEVYKKQFLAEAALQYRKLKNTYSFEHDISQALKQVKALNKAGAKLSQAKIKAIKAECFKVELKRADEIVANRKAAAKRVADGRKLLKNSWKNNLNNEVSNEHSNDNDSQSNEVKASSGQGL